MTFISIGLSDHHKLVNAMIEQAYPKIPPKEIYYRNYKQYK